MYDDDLRKIVSNCRIRKKKSRTASTKNKVNFLLSVVPEQISYDCEKMCLAETVMFLKKMTCFDRVCTECFYQSYEFCSKKHGGPNLSKFAGKTINVLHISTINNIYNLILTLTHLHLLPCLVPPYENQTKQQISIYRI